MLLKEQKKEENIEIVKILQQYFAIEGQIKHLQGEVDLNYYVDSLSGKYNLKIASSATSIEEIEFQTCLLTYIAKATELELPKTINSINGNGYEHVVWNGENRLIRLLTWVEGGMFAHVNPHSKTLLHNIGSATAELTKLLEGFHHPYAEREYKWDPLQAHWVKNHIQDFKSKEEREIITHFYEQFEKSEAKINTLRKSVTHNDVNDYNIVIGAEDKVAGIIDFGDAINTATICELAILLAYALMGKEDPIRSAIVIIKAYHASYPLQQEELEVLFSLIAIRVVISVTNSMISKKNNPENEYLLISEKPGWDLLRKLQKESSQLATIRFLHACGFENEIHTSIQNLHNTTQPNKVVNISTEKVHWFDLSVGSTELGIAENYIETKRFTKQVFRTLEDQEIDLGIGKYGEIRPIYTTDGYLCKSDDGPQWRTLHLGLDWFVKEGVEVFAVLDGKVHSKAINNNGKDYGPTIILEHHTEGAIFYSLYGHLAKKGFDRLSVGDSVKKGQVIGYVGNEHENGDWPPHLHFQLITDMCGFEGDFPGVCYADEFDFWKTLSPDPTHWFELNEPKIERLGASEIVEARKQRLGRSLSISYNKPLHLVRGYMQYLYDATGRRYLDMVNNVAHVGHENARVVAAGQQQMSVLNTNTRYLHDSIVKLADELLATMPKHLTVCHFVNSGSEANELALRMAKNYTGGNEMVVMETGYHGNTNGCIEISSYKFDGKGGSGAPSHIHVVPTPDEYRGKYKGQGEGIYTQFVKDAIANMESKDQKLAGFIAESILSCAGQVPLPSNFLKDTYDIIHKAGGVCIADEVQTGIGRVGDKFWSFELQDVKPDIVTIGKPLGNGHPMAAVVTTAEVANRFANGMEYFNTFGGNPVSCAIALEVLQIVKEENLQEHARVVGNELINGLQQLKKLYPIIGDVRGYGLFSGFELVRHQEDQIIPAANEASYLSNRMRDKGVLMSTDGSDHNVLKLKPPMCFNRNDLSFFLEQLEVVLKEDFMQ